jgi:hypothetical protein
MNYQPEHWTRRVVGSLVLLLAIALGTRLAWDMLSPVVPALVAVVTLGVVYGLLFQKWRR